MAYIDVDERTEYLLMIFSISGKRVQVSLKKKDTQENRRAAERLKKDVERWVDAGNLDELCREFPASKPLQQLSAAREFNGAPVAPPTLAEFMPTWLDSLAGDKLSTLAAYDSIYHNWIEPCPVRNAAGKAIGRLVDRRLDQFSADDGDTFKGWLLSKDGPRTDAVRKKAFFQLRRMFQAARLRKKTTGMTDDPLAHIDAKKKFNLDTPKQRKEREEALSAWSDRETQALIDAAYALNPQWGAIVEVAFFTGLRRGELLGLKWDDIDFEGKLISINQTLRPSPVREGSRLAERIRQTGIGVIEAGYQFVSTTKTVGSADTIAMLPRVAQALREHRQRVQLRSREGWVFITREGGPLSLNNFARDSWRVIVEKAGVPFRSFEQTRHTFAQLVLTYGGTGNGTLQWLKRMMRHTNLNMLINHYLRHDQQEGRPGFLGAAEGPVVTRLWANFGQRETGASQHQRVV